MELSKHRYIITIIFACLFNSFVMGQISISADDINSLKGTIRGAMAPNQDSSSAFIQIDKGGSDKIWDYRDIITDGYIVGSMEYLEPDEGFQAELFPESNFRQRLFAESSEGSLIFETYFRITSSEFQTLGSASSFAGFSFTELNSDDTAPLPMTYGSSWLSVTEDSSEQIGFLTITTDTTFNQVDSWGLLRLPTADIECLRIREDSKTISSTFYNGAPLGDPESTETVSYVWLSKSHLLAMTVDSLDNGMGALTMMITPDATSVLSDEDLPITYNLKQNYPNPFNPTTTITYSIPKASFVSLIVYDILGNEIEELENGYKTAGQYSQVFDSANLSSGIYFYTLKAENFTQTKKMLLIR